MKNTTRFNIHLLMTALILTAALAVPAAAQKQVPFMGAMQGHDTDVGITNNLALRFTDQPGERRQRSFNPSPYFPFIGRFHLERDRRRCDDGTIDFRDRNRISLCSQPDVHSQ